MKEQHEKLSAAICLLLDKAKADMLETLMEEQNEAGEPAFGPEFYESLKDGCQIMMDVTFWEKDAKPPHFNIRGQIGDGITGVVVVELGAFSVDGAPQEKNEPDHRFAPTAVHIQHEKDGPWEKVEPMNMAGVVAAELRHKQRKEGYK